MHIGFTTYLATLALASAHQEVNVGMTNMHPLEHAAIIAERDEFRDLARCMWVDTSGLNATMSLHDLDALFNEFYDSLDQEDVAFLAAAIGS